MTEKMGDTFVKEFCSSGLDSKYRCIFVYFNIIAFHLIKRDIVFCYDSKNVRQIFLPNKYKNSDIVMG